MLNAFQCSILVKAPFDWVENNEDGKRGDGKGGGENRVENEIFSYLVQRENKRERKWCGK